MDRGCHAGSDIPGNVGARGSKEAAAPLGMCEAGGTETVSQTWCRASRTGPGRRAAGRASLPPAVLK